MRSSLTPRRAGRIAAPLVEPLDEALRRRGDRRAGRKDRVDAGGDAPVRGDGMSMVATDAILSDDEIAQAIQGGMACRLDSEPVAKLLEFERAPSPIRPGQLEQRARMRDRLVDNRIDLFGHRIHSPNEIAGLGATRAPIT